MELNDALSQIAEIRAGLARAETFRGYRSATVALSGCLAVAAGVVQAAFLPNPRDDLAGYLALWVSAAAVSLIATACEMTARCLASASPHAVRKTRQAAESFLPCVAAGAVVTAVLARTAPECAWLLPGLWSLFFALGVFASSRLLPRATAWVGVFYLAAGTALLLAGGRWALSPWLMAGTFGVGQFLAAGILYWSLERPHEPQ